jgi:hypothetical protein
MGSEDLDNKIQDFQCPSSPLSLSLPHVNYRSLSCSHLYYLLYSYSWLTDDKKIYIGSPLMDDTGV